MTHKQLHGGLGYEGKSKKHAGHHSGGVKHRSRHRGFKFKDMIPWYFIIGVLAGLAAAWLMSLLFVNPSP